MDYIDRIRALRKAQGLTQKDMADVLGVATSMYNMYETRQRRMYVETFATLCSYFGVCCFSRKMRKVCTKNEKSMLQNCNIVL